MDTLPQGQSSKSPAFSFYAKEWLAATLSWALDARGAYATLLAYQWDSGSVPGDDMAALARVLGVSSPKARLVWSVISSKFERAEDGLWCNVRLEQERDKQAARRAALAANGARGGRPPKNQTTNQTETNRFTEIEPNENLTESLSSSSSSSSGSNEPQKTTTKERGGGLIESPLQFARLQQLNAYVGVKLRVPNMLHAELMAKSGVNADQELRSWYARLDEELERSGKATGDVFVWLRPRHQAYAIEQGWIERAPKAQPKQQTVAEIVAAIEADRAARR